MAEATTREITIGNETFEGLVIQKLEDVLDVDESDPDKIRRSHIDGAKKHKYRNAWFTEVKAWVEVAMIEVLGIDEMPETETDQAHEDRINNMRQMNQGEPTTLENAMDVKTIDHNNFEEIEFPAEYYEIMQIENVEGEQMGEFGRIVNNVFDYWGDNLGGRYNRREDVEVGKRIVRLVLGKLYEGYERKDEL